MSIEINKYQLIFLIEETSLYKDTTHTNGMSIDIY